MVIWEYGGMGVCDMGVCEWCDMVVWEYECMVIWGMSEYGDMGWYMVVW